MTTGRKAKTPGEIPRRGWKAIASRTFSRMGELHVLLMAGGVAFYALLAIFPGIAAAVALLGLVYEPGSLVEQSQWLLNLMPEEAATIIAEQMAKVASAGDGALGLAAILSIAIALWSSSGTVGALVEGLNVIYGETDERGFVKNKLLTISLTIGMILGMGLALAVVAAIPAVLAFVGASETLTDAAMILRWPVLFAIAIGGIAVLYRYGPDRRAAEWRWLTPGAVLACVLWVAGSYGFSVYVQSFASYNETFGALAGVIILLTWLWLSAFIVFLGALIDAEAETQTEHDTTVGPDRERGERDAVKADAPAPSPDGDASDGSEPRAFAAR